MGKAFQSVRIMRGRSRPQGSSTSCSNALAAEQLFPIASLTRGLPLLLRDSRGAVTLEYTVLVGGVAVASLLGFIAVGVAVTQNFSFVRSLLLCPIP